MLSRLYTFKKRPVRTLLSVRVTVSFTIIPIIKCLPSRFLKSIMISRSLKKKWTLYSFVRKRKLSLFSVNEEVREALRDKKPVIALESTIITHGMKFPHNFDTAREVENIIRQQQAIPATIAVLKGRIKVGLSCAELEELSRKQEHCLKVSRRDFPYVMSQKLSGGTTVSGTIVVAHKMGIPIFVTGGVGGVHREVELTMDVSADITELGRTSIAVISSGVKSILDIPRTLEQLETHGVAVATFGPSPDFPAFYCRRSGLKSPYNLNSYRDAAEFIQSAKNLNSGSGVLIAVPIPEEHSLDDKVMESIIEKGLNEAKDMNLRGKDVTPFLLNRISEITKGKSLQSNIALIKNNALVGAKIAVELAKLGENEWKSSERMESFCEVCGHGENKWKSSAVFRRRKNDNFDAVIIGGTNLDFVVNIKDNDFKPKAVFFTCIDSRMIPTRFTETCVGDMFVVRNAGNIIPHSKWYPDEITTNEPAALELGCVLNDVRHIIVCGHSDCKAMNLLYSLRNEEFSSQTSRRMSPLRAWMCAHASSSLDRFLRMQKEGADQPLVFHAETPLRKFVAYIDPKNKFRTEDKLSQVNTLQQLQNIASYGFLKDRLERYDLHIHALWFDIYTGDIYYFSRCAKEFVEVNEDNITALLREMDGRTVAGKITQGGGGVARNVADALGKLHVNALLVSAVGDDPFGSFVLEETIPHLSDKGIMKARDASTGTCVVLCDPAGECLAMVGDMAVHEKITKEHVRSHQDAIASSSLVVLDGNLSQETTEMVLQLCHEKSVPVWFEPTDLFRATKPFLRKDVPVPTFISPNFMEFRKIFETVHPESLFEENTSQVEECLKKGYFLAELIDNIIITLGKDGVIVIRRGGALDPFFCTAGRRKLLQMSGPISHRIYIPHTLTSDEIMNVSGAGDCFAGGFIAAMLKGESEKDCVEAGFRCATASLKCSDPVPKTF